MNRAEPPVDDPVIRPFRGLRYDPAAVDLAAVTTDPMPADDPAVTAAALGRDPRNVAWLIDPVLRGTAPSAGVTAAARLASWCRAGVVRREPQPAMYVYRFASSGYAALGVVAALTLPPVSTSRVLGHEGVDATRVERHLRLLAALSAQPEPLVVVHPPLPALRRILIRTARAKPLVSLQSSTSSGSTVTEHRLWGVTGAAELRALAESLAGHQLLIADGHHRYAALRRLQAQRAAGGDRFAPAPWDSALALLIGADDPGLRVGAISRLVRGLSLKDITATPGIRTRPLLGQPDAEDFLGPTGGERVRFVATDGHRWMAAVREGSTDSSGRDVAAVTYLDDTCLPFWHVPSGAVRHEPDLPRALIHVRAIGGVAFLLPSLSIGQIWRAAESGRLLPAKATTFGPKPRVGLVWRSWSDSVNDLTDPARAPADAGAGGEPSTPRRRSG